MWAVARGIEQPPAVQVGVSLAVLTGFTVLLVPAVVLAGFAAAGAWRIGVAPTAIVLGTLWLLHRKIVALAGAAAEARQARDAIVARSTAQQRQAEAREQELAGHAAELVRAHETTAYALTKLVEARDPSTGVHLERVRAYAKLLAVTLSHAPRWRGTLDERFISAVHTASPLHDIGKVGIADMILLKPGKLTAEETALMRRHATMGGRTLRDIARRGGDNPYIETAYEVAMYHHERWDGTGYPFALPGPHIPIAARIVALADVYDALTSKRCYKPAFSHSEARTYIVEQSGRHFDPEVVEAFLARELDFVRIREALTGDLPIESADLPELVPPPRLRGAA